MDDPNINLIDKRARRAIATILGFKDDHLYVPDDLNEDFRSVVMDQVNQLAHLSIDIINSISEVGPTNKIYIDLLQELRDELMDQNGDTL